MRRKQKRRNKDMSEAAKTIVRSRTMSFKDLYVALVTENTAPAAAIPWSLFSLLPDLHFEP